MWPELANPEGRQVNLEVLWAQDSAALEGPFAGNAVIMCLHAVHTITLWHNVAGGTFLLFGGWFTTALRTLLAS